MALQVQERIVQTFAQPNLADIYGPYPTTNIADIAVTAAGVKCAGLTVGIKDATTGVVTEWWYQPVEEQLQLVEKGGTSGGTEVEANPEGTPTAILSKLKIGETIYTAPQGPVGPPGADGQDGQDGQDGRPGVPGPANTLTIGTVTDGETAAAEITGASPNQTLNLTLPRGQQGIPGQDGADAVNPFKGWFGSSTELENKYPSAQAGDFANVLVSSTTYIFKWNVTANSNAGGWVNTNEVADTNNTQTFKTGQSVSAVAIDDTHLANPVSADETNAPILPKGSDVMALKYKLGEIDYNETKVDLTQYDVLYGYPQALLVSGRTVGEIRYAQSTKYLIMPVTGVDTIRVSGLETTSSASVNGGIVFYDVENASDLMVTQSASSVLDVSSHVVGEPISYKQDATSQRIVDLSVPVPQGATFVCILCKASALPEEKFYCYLCSGNKVSVYNSRLKGANLIEKKVCLSYNNILEGVVLTRPNQAWNMNVGTIGNSSEASYCIIPVSGAKRVRFLGMKSSPTGVAGAAFYDVDSASQLSKGTTVLDVSQYVVGIVPFNNATTNEPTGIYEYVVDVPANAKYLCTTYKNSTIGDKFYCYLQYGSSLEDIIPSSDNYVELDLLEKSEAEVSNFGVERFGGHSIQNDEWVANGSAIIIKLENVLSLIVGKNRINPVRVSFLSDFGSFSDGEIISTTAIKDGDGKVEIEVPNGSKYAIVSRTDSDSDSLDDLYKNLLPSSIGIFTKKVSSLHNRIDTIDSQLYDGAESIMLDYYLKPGRYINTDNYLWSNGNGNANCYIIPVEEGDVFLVGSPTTTGYTAYCAFLTSDDTTLDSQASFVDGEIIHWFAGGTGLYHKLIAPKTARYLYINKNTTGTGNHTPSDVKVSRKSSLLVKGTFNSSYNTEDTSDTQKKFCLLMKNLDKVETFMFFTDPHLTDYSRYENMTEFIRDKYISALQKYYNSLPLDNCICGGDWLNFYHTDAEACAYLGYCDAYMRKLFKNYRPIIGNHDNNPYQDGTFEISFAKSLPWNTVRNLMMRGESEDGNTWYSFDGINTKFYCLNNGSLYYKQMTNNTYPDIVNIRWPQVEWLGRRLENDDAEHSIIVSHAYSNATNIEDWFSTETGTWALGITQFGDNIRKLCEAYNNRAQITLNGNSYDFTGCTGRVAFYLCGHTHFDYIDTTNELPVVAVTDLEGGYLETPNGTKKYALTPTFDNILVDYDNNRLYMVRVGVGVSRIIDFIYQPVAIGDNIALTSALGGTLSWQSRDTSKAIVSNGIVAGVSAGNVGIIATAEDGTQEYWFIKVS